MKQIKGIWLPDSDTHFESKINDKGHYQREQFKTVLKHIKPNDRGLFIDVGAHVGLWSKMAIDSGFVVIHCFEPDQDNFECLKKNLNTEGYLMRLDNFALSDTEEYGYIEKGDPDNSGAHFIKSFAEADEDLRPCNAYPFDTVYDKRIPLEFIGKILIKIDVQGYEAKVVRGMTNFIKEYKPIIIVEQWLNGKEDHEAAIFLESIGMKVLGTVKKEVILGW